jgi:hypothetical protein
MLVIKLYIIFNILILILKSKYNVKEMTYKLIIHIL